MDACKKAVRAGKVTACDSATVEKLRMGVDNLPRSAVSDWPNYAAPNLTETSFDTPGSCIVTP